MRQRLKSSTGQNTLANVKPGRTSWRAWAETQAVLTPRSPGPGGSDKKVKIHADDDALEAGVVARRALKRTPPENPTKGRAASAAVGPESRAPTSAWRQERGVRLDRVGYATQKAAIAISRPYYRPARPSAST